MNEYYERWLRATSAQPRWFENTPERVARSFAREWQEREACVNYYSWAIPDDQALDTIQPFSPIVELGAGTGYWAMLLRHRGVEIKPFDTNPEGMSRKLWVPVPEAHAEVLASHPDHTLMLIWPPYGSAMASVALRAYAGEHLIYAGEGAGGCTGDDEFHRQLAESWTLVVEKELPQWQGIHDRLTVYRRTRQRYNRTGATKGRME